MYSKQEIAYLLKSGFSMSEIMATDGITPTDTPVKEPESPVTEPEAPVAPAPVPSAPVDTNAPVLAAIENLTKAIQAGNIRAGGFASPVGEVTADSILANIINPPGYTGEKI